MNHSLSTNFWYRYTYIPVWFYIFKTLQSLIYNNISYVIGKKLRLSYLLLLCEIIITQYHHNMLKQALEQTFDYHTIIMYTYHYTNIYIGP